MSGIQIYTSSPINPSKASGATPQTASTSSSAGGSATATGTTTATYPPTWPPAAAFPGPTSYAQQDSPLQPTPTTTTTASDAPPPPQPGAFPTARNAAPPLNVSEKYQPAPASQPMPQPYPHQMAIPPPNTGFGTNPPASTTSVATTASTPYPVPIPTRHGAPRQSFEHPPGYQQNTYASELTSDQRRAQDAHNDSTGLGGDSESAGGIFNTAKQWVSIAGNKISETESEIWRRINKE